MLRSGEVGKKPEKQSEKLGKQQRNTKNKKKNKIKAKLETESLKAHSFRLTLPHSLSLSFSAFA